MGPKSAISGARTRRARCIGPVSCATTRFDEANRASVSGSASPTTSQGTTGSANSTTGTSGSVSGNTSTSGQTGTTGTTTTETPGTTTTGQTGTMGTTAATGDLQGQIQNALRSEPTLSNDNINVSVTDDRIDLSGTVATGKEKQTAKRIAQSYAGNRKVKEHLTVSGKGNSNMGASDRDRDSGTSNPSGNTGSNPPSSNTSGTNPEGNKTNPPSGSQPPVR